MPLQELQRLSCILSEQYVIVSPLIEDRHKPDWPEAYLYQVGNRAYMADDVQPLSIILLSPPGSIQDRHWRIYLQMTCGIFRLIVQIRNMHRTLLPNR